MGSGRPAESPAASSGCTDRLWPVASLSLAFLFCEIGSIQRREVRERLSTCTCARPADNAPQVLSAKCKYFRDPPATPDPRGARTEARGKHWDLLSGGFHYTVHEYSKIRRASPDPEPHLAAHRVRGTGAQLEPIGTTRGGPFQHHNPPSPHRLEWEVGCQHRRTHFTPS